MKNFLFVLTLALIATFSSCGNKGVDTKESDPNKTSMNTTMQDLLTRRSVRSYTDQIPSKEVIEEICEAGTYAPTGMNKQAPIIIAVTNREVRDQLSRLNAAVMGNDSDPFYGAPVVLV